jgi:copper resistance protein B
MIRSALVTILLLLHGPAAAAAEEPAPHEHGVHEEEPASHEHGAPAEAPTEPDAGNEPPPEAPADHAADAFFDPAAMEAARAQLRREHGGSLFSKVMLNLGEYRVQPGGSDGYRWEGEGRFGNSIDRLVVKTEGESGVGLGLDSAELQGLYSRAISPFFDVQAGFRQDLKPTTRRTYATIGIEGLAPLWFNTQGALFVSDKGDVLLRLEGSYDVRLFQRVVLQPQAELNFAAQDMPELEYGEGLSTLSTGLRLRYEIRRELAPYVGYTFDRNFGDTADFKRKSGEGASSHGFVVGLRAWF